MNCHEAKKHWHLRLETNVDDAALDEHLRSCSSCGVYDKDMTTVLDRLSGLRQSTEQIGVIDKTPYLERQGHQEQHTIKRRSWVSVAMRIAAVIGIVAAASMYYSNSGDKNALPEQIVQSDKPATVVEAKPAVATAEPYQNLGLSLRGNSAKKYMAVALTSSNPTVHIYTLYETFDN